MEYSKPIANAVSKYLVENDWSFVFNSDSGFFNFKFSLLTMDYDLKLFLYVYDTYFIVYGVCPVTIDVRKIKAVRQVGEFLHRVNDSLKCGNWNIDLDTGHINYRVCTECVGLDAPSDDMICSVICCVIAMIERYCSGIEDVANGNMDVKTAIEFCMNKDMDFDT